MISKPYQSSRSIWQQVADAFYTAYVNLYLRAAERSARRDDQDPFGFIGGRAA